MKEHLKTLKSGGFVTIQKEELHSFVMAVMDSQVKGKELIQFDLDYSVEGCVIIKLSKNEI